ncbi:MAG: phage tail protein [Phycisphaerae bacterium]|nr:phage tail protein [Phycisphaerae bacterium]
MRQRGLTIRLLAALCLLALTAGSLSAFTYQGRLHDQGDSAQGDYDMYFSLYDSPVKGKRVAETIELPEVPVTHGYFTVELEFDASVFNGQPRWLHIAIRRSGSGLSPQAVLPRQKISPTPQALHAGVADRIEPPAFISNYIVRMSTQGEADRYFHYVDGIRSETEVIEYMDGEDQVLRKRPGRTRYANVELKTFASADRFLDSWYGGVRNGMTDRKTIRLAILNQDGFIVDHYDMEYCWPRLMRYDYQPRSNTVVMTVALATELITRLSIPPKQLPDYWQPGPQPVVKGPFAVKLPTGYAVSFASIAAVGAETEVTEYLDGEDRILRKRPGRTRYFDPTFAPAQRNTILDAWRQGVIDGRVERKTVTLSLNNSAGAPVILCTLFHCWPSATRTEPAAAANAFIQSVTWATEQVEISAPE